MLELAEEQTGKLISFNLYEDKDLPFLKGDNPNSQVIKKSIIDSNIDDDCQTEEEQQQDAEKMMKEDLASAITQYLKEKKDGSVTTFVKNLDPKRFERAPFN